MKTSTFLIKVHGKNRIVYFYRKIRKTFFVLPFVRLSMNIKIKETFLVAIIVSYCGSVGRTWLSGLVGFQIYSWNYRTTSVVNSSTQELVQKRIQVVAILCIHTRVHRIPHSAVIALRDSANLAVHRVCVSSKEKKTEKTNLIDICEPQRRLLKRTDLSRLSNFEFLINLEFCFYSRTISNKELFKWFRVTIVNADLKKQNWVSIINQWGIIIPARQKFMERKRIDG